MSNVKKICADCGSDNVWQDASAVWSFPDQDWELEVVYDQGYCDDCDSPTTISEIIIEKGTKDG